MALTRPEKVKGKGLVALWALLIIWAVLALPQMALAQTAPLLMPLWDAPQGIAKTQEALAWRHQFEEQSALGPRTCLPEALNAVNLQDPVRAYRLQWAMAPVAEREVIFLQEPIAATFAVVIVEPERCVQVFVAGRAHEFSRRKAFSPYPNMAMPALSDGAEVYVLIQDAKSIRPWVRLASEANFQRENLAIWMLLAAFSGVLILVIVVVISFSSRSPTVVAYSVYVFAFIAWMMQNFGVGFAWFPALFAPASFAILQAVAVAGVVSGIGWTIVEFLQLRGAYRLLLGGTLTASVLGFLASIWWPSSYRIGSLALASSALIAIVQLVLRLKDSDLSVRLFALGLGATIVGGGTQALSVVLAGSQASGWAVYAFTIGSFTQAMFWLAAITHRLRAERRSLIHWRQDELEQQITKATHELMLKKEIAEEATRARSDFLAAASHDLRQPTHALGLLITRMGQFQMNSEMRQVFQSLQNSVHAMQDLLDGLMDYTRLDSGSEQFNQRPIALRSILASMEESLTSTAHARGLRLRFRPTSLWVISDPSLLSRMVMNLVLNAIRYTPKGTVLIACRAVQHGQKVHIEVWDSGIGIAKEHHTQIFKEFFQIGNTARDRGKGIGLGLSIVQRSADLLGHTVQLRSALGCGSRFTICLPASTSGQMSPERPTELPLRALADLSGVSVLVIEDDTISREALQDLLETWGCTVRAAANASQAQALVMQATPDVIVSDYRLGGPEHGAALIARLRKMVGQEIPACLISGDLDTGLMFEANSNGLTLLHKPVRPAKLRALVRRLAMRTDGSGAA